MSSMFIPLSFSPLQQPVQIPSAAFVIFLVSKHVGGNRSRNSELRVWTYKSLYGVFITFFTLFCCSKYIHIKEVLCGFSKFELLMVQPWSFSLQQMKSRKRLAHDVFHTFATHAGLVHDVSVTDYLAQNWQHLQSWFCNLRRLKIWNKDDC